MAQHTQNTPLVSAIVSTFASERFMRGCLDDLVGQTLFGKGNLEIIVIDACSPENERAIVEEYQARYGAAIVYQRTETRERVYASWNRAIRIARGKYLTSANTDDRHRQDALERMAEVLEARTDIGLVYADCKITTIENETFKENTAAGSFAFPDYSRGMLTIGCFIGPQPMWRKSLHDTSGFFDEQYISSGDWEFWLRAASQTSFLHIPECLGLYLSSPTSIEHVNQERRLHENQGIVNTYLPRYLSSIEDVRAGLGSIQRWRARHPGRRGFEDIAEGLIAARNRLTNPTLRDRHISIVIAGSRGQHEKTVKRITSETQTRPDVELVAVPTSDRRNTAQRFNDGIIATSGERIVLLEDVDDFSPGWLDRLIGLLSAEESNGVVGPAVLTSPDEFTDAVRCTAVARGMQSEVRSLRFGCLAVPRDLLDAIGVFDERFQVFGKALEDLCLRTWIHGSAVRQTSDCAVLVKSALIDPKQATASQEILVAKWSDVDATGEFGHKVFVFNVLTRVRDAEAMGDFELAVRMLDEAIKGDPAHAPFHTRRAWHLVRMGKWEELTAIVNETPDAVKSDPQWLSIAGYCAEQSNDDEIARQCASHAARLQPHSMHPLLLEGHLALKRGDAGEAEDLYRGASELAPREGEPAAFLGALLWSLDRRDEGFRALEHAAGLNPADEMVLASYCDAAIALEEYDRAAMVCKQALLLFPRHHGVRRMLSRVCAAKGDVHEALRIVLATIASGPFETEDLTFALSLRAIEGPLGTGDVRPMLSLAMIVKDEEQNLPLCLTSAARLVDEMIVIDTGSSDRTREVARAFGAKVFEQEWHRDFSEARNRAIVEARGDWILSLDADEVIAEKEFPLIRSMCAKGTTARGYLFTTRNYVHAPDVIGWRRNQGTYLEEAGTGWIPSEKVRLFPRRDDVRFANRVHEAVEASIEKAGIPILHVDVPIHHYGKLNQEKTRQKAQEYLVMGRLKLQEAGDAKSILELAVQEQELGNYHEAIGLWHRLLALHPEANPAIAGIGICHHRLGEYDAAIEFLARAAKTDEGLREVQVLYGLTLLHLRKVDEAVSHLRACTKRDPSYPMYFISLALALACAGHIPEARDILARQAGDRVDAAIYFEAYTDKFRQEGLNDFADAVGSVYTSNRQVNHIHEVSHA